MLTTKQVSAKIKSIAGRSSKLVEDIQVAAVACAQHSHVYGDYTLACNLVDAVGKGAKREALRLWLARFGAMNTTSKSEQKKDGVLCMRYAKAKRLEGDELAMLMIEAESTPWFEANTEKDAHEWSVNAGFAQLMRKIDKAVADGSSEFSEADMALVRQLRAIRDNAIMGAQA